MVIIISRFKNRFLLILPLSVLIIYWVEKAFYFIKAWKAAVSESGTEFLSCVDSIQQNLLKFASVYRASGRCKVLGEVCGDQKDEMLWSLQI